MYLDYRKFKQHTLKNCKIDINKTLQCDTYNIPSMYNLPTVIRQRRLSR